MVIPTFWWNRHDYSLVVAVGGLMALASWLALWGFARLTVLAADDVRTRATELGADAGHRLRSMGRAFALAYTAVMLMVALDPFDETVESMSRFLMLVAGALWTARNRRGIPYLIDLAAMVDSRRLAAVLRFARGYALGNFALMVVLAALDRSATPNASTRLLAQLIALVLVGWLVAWPLGLAYLLARVQRIEQGILHGRGPKIVASAAAL
jgi:hypothetical protein